MCSEVRGEGGALEGGGARPELLDGGGEGDGGERGGELDVGGHRDGGDGEHAGEERFIPLATSIFERMALLKKTN